MFEAHELKGVIPLELPGLGGTVMAEFELNAAGEFVFKFSSYSLGESIMELAVRNQLVMLSLSYAAATSAELKQPADGEDFLDTVNGNLAWFHKCRIEGDITLSPNLGSCPHCGTIQITRRKP